MIMEWVGHVACLGEMRNAYKILVGRYEGKRSYLWGWGGYRSTEKDAQVGTGFV